MNTPIISPTDSHNFQPNFATKDADLSKEELNKLASNGMRGQLSEEFRSDTPDLSWESEQLAKSYGIYLEFNRAQTGREKDWNYMLRIAIPGGGAITGEQWLKLDELSERYTKGPSSAPSIRLTTRQAVQFHWVKKEAVIPILQSLAESRLFTLNGCGDNVRNIMSCPLSDFSVFDGNQLARKLARFFALPTEPLVQIFAIDPNYLRETNESSERTSSDLKQFQYSPKLLNRKFKIAISGVQRDSKTGKWVADNCVELRTNDLGIAPVLEDEKLLGYQIYVGGGQGEKNGKPTLSVLSQPLAFVSEEELFPVLDAVVRVHQEWGDRQNRHWARLKYIIKKQGIAWYREQVEVTLGNRFKLNNPLENHDCGSRHLHHGWIAQPGSSLLSYGAFFENGRITDGSPNGKLKSMVRETVKKYPVHLTITPNQDLLFSNIPTQVKEAFEADLITFGYGKRNDTPYSKLRLHSGACVGRDTCRLAYTDSEKFEPFLIDELEKLGWGDLAESIGITGCERQCFRPGTKSIGLVGTGLNRYQFKLMGTEDARHQGRPLYSESFHGTYLQSVPRERIALVIDAFFRFYTQEKKTGESLGYFHQRIGEAGLISYLSQDSATADLFKIPTKVTVPRLDTKPLAKEVREVVPHG